MDKYIKRYAYILQCSRLTFICQILPSRKEATEHAGLGRRLFRIAVVLVRVVWENWFYGVYLHLGRFSIKSLYTVRRLAELCLLVVLVGWWYSFSLEFLLRTRMYFIYLFFPFWLIATDTDNQSSPICYTRRRIAAFCSQTKEFIHHVLTPDASDISQLPGSDNYIISNFEPIGKPVSAVYSPGKWTVYGLWGAWRLTCCSAEGITSPATQLCRHGSAGAAGPDKQESTFCGGISRA